MLKFFEIQLSHDGHLNPLLAACALGCICLDTSAHPPTYVCMYVYLYVYMDELCVRASVRQN